jgi:hypothetical protein
MVVQVVCCFLDIACSVMNAFLRYFTSIYRQRLTFTQPTAARCPDYSPHFGGSTTRDGSVVSRLTVTFCPVLLSRYTSFVPFFSSSWYRDSSCCTWSYVTTVCEDSVVG